MQRTFIICYKIILIPPEICFEAVNRAGGEIINGNSNKILQLNLPSKDGGNEQLLFSSIPHLLPLNEVRECHCSFWEILLSHSIPFGPVVPPPLPSIVISSGPTLGQLDTPGNLNLGWSVIIWVPSPSQSLAIQVFPRSLLSL